MKRIISYIGILAVVLTMTACSDDDSFTTDSANVLTFTADTLKMDTVFSNVGSATYTFWAYNHTDKGIRLNSVRLKNGNQTGFRVNVDGSYLDNSLGAVVTNLEVRKGDSLRVFVELTSPEVNQLEPQMVADDLVFQLESGTEQRVRLQAWAWDAEKWTDKVISRDTTIDTRVPIIIYGSGLRVDSGAVLTLRGTALYFHDGAGIDVYGRLEAEDCVMRGDRLDYMFDYLPYDRVSGQWRGIRLQSSSGDNKFTDCEIRNAVDAIVCDSTTLHLFNTIVHNSSGEGLSARHSTVVVDYCQFTNTYGDCLGLHGCQATVQHSTLAQFYPFSANRGYALHFVNTKQYHMTLECLNTIVTGYADDVVMGVKADSTTTDLVYHFTDCLLRTPKKEDEEHIVRVIFETPKDSVQGKQHFRTIDEDNLYYDFAIDSISPAFQNAIGRIVQ